MKGWLLGVSYCLMGTELHFCKMQELCRRMLVTVAEYYLLSARVDIERTVFFDYQVKFFVVVATVYPQAFEHIGIVFREIEAENLPAISIV